MTVRGTELFGRKYFFGAPIGNAAKRDYLNALYQSRGQSHLAVTDYLAAVLSRTTDKSNGLLQVASIFSAIAFLLAGPTSQAGDKGFAFLGVLLLFVVCLVLATNLAVVWGVDEHLHLGTRPYNETMLNLCTSRIVRFTIASRVAVASIALLGIQTMIEFGFFNVLAKTFLVQADAP